MDYVCRHASYTLEWGRPSTDSKNGQCTALLTQYRTKQPATCRVDAHWWNPMKSSCLYKRLKQIHPKKSLTQWFRPSPTAVERIFPFEEMMTAFDVVAPLWDIVRTRNHECLQRIKEEFSLPFHASINFSCGQCQFTVWSARICIL